MRTQVYDFLTGIETGPAPGVTDPGAVPGDVFILGQYNAFTIANNTGPANVTGCVFDKAVYRSVILLVQVYRSAAGGALRSETYLFKMVNDGSAWSYSKGDFVSQVSTGMDAGVELTVTSAGQVQYTSDDNGGSYSAPNSVLKWRVFDLMEVA